jgi:hypothetical protein
VTESVSFSFARKQRVQVKEAPHVFGKVVAQHVSSSGEKQYIVQTIKPDGDQLLQWWDEDELEPAAAASSAPTVEEKRAPAIADVAHAAFNAVVNHPTTVAEVGKAVDAAMMTGGSAANNIKSAVTAALATVAKMAITDPQVKQAAGDAAKTAAASAPKAA